MATSDIHVGIDVTPGNIQVAVLQKQPNGALRTVHNQGYPLPVRSSKPTPVVVTDDMVRLFLDVQSKHPNRPVRECTRDGLQAVVDACLVGVVARSRTA